VYSGYRFAHDGIVCVTINYRIGADGPHMVVSADSAQRVGQRLAERLGVAPTQAEIAAVPLGRSLQAQAELLGDLGANPDPERWGAEAAVSMMPWQPVIDGDADPPQSLADAMHAAWVSFATTGASRMAAVRPSPPSDHALRYHSWGRGRSEIRRAGTVGGRAIARPILAALSAHVDARPAAGSPRRRT
jgi:hypothetical protein